MNLPLLKTCVLVALSLSCTSCGPKPKNNEEGRTSAHPIHPLFLARRSKSDLHSTLSQEAIREHLKSLFEAARWAPSSYNGQPWRFIYGIKGTPAWDRLYSILVPFNQKWVANADALILVISKNISDHNGQPVPTHSFDTGLAVSQLFLEATSRGLISHGMSGFDYDKARMEYGIPKDYTVEAMIAIGEPASKEHSTKEFAERDAKPAQRKSTEEFAFEGKFIA